MTTGEKAYQLYMGEKGFLYWLTQGSIYASAAVVIAWVCHPYILVCKGVGAIGSASLVGWRFTFVGGGGGDDCVCVVLKCDWDTYDVHGVRALLTLPPEGQIVAHVDVCRSAFALLDQHLASTRFSRLRCIKGVVC